jgi:hypothetical protein
MQQTINHITKCRAREVVYQQHDGAKPECRWKRDGTGDAKGYSCTACGRFVDGESSTGDDVAAAFGVASLRDAGVEAQP